MRINSSKKADISMNTIVYAAVAIMVLLVIILVFTNNIKTPNKQFKDLSGTEVGKCNNIIYGRSCESSCEGGTKFPEYTDCQGGQVCCEKGTAS